MGRRLFSKPANHITGPEISWNGVCGIEFQTSFILIPSLLQIHGLWPKLRSRAYALTKRPLFYLSYTIGLYFLKTASFSSQLTNMADGTPTLHHMDVSVKKPH